MPIELLVPIVIFVLGVIISDITSSTAVALVEKNEKS